MPACFGFRHGPPLYGIRPPTFARAFARQRLKVIQQPRPALGPWRLTVRLRDDPKERDAREVPRVVRDERQVH